MCSVILLAGGKGSRIPSPIPKQFLELRGKPIVLHSFDLFSQFTWVDEIIVVVEPLYQGLFSKRASKKILFALPGLRRQDSVFNGLQRVALDSQYVLIHDSARPFVKKEDVERVFEEAKNVGAATLGTPVKNTIKQTDHKGFVLSTLERDSLWEIQTPQVIEKEMLLQGFAKARAENLTVTDDVSLVELLGSPVKIVSGAYSNLKITTPEDLLIHEI